MEKSVLLLAGAIFFELSWAVPLSAGRTIGVILITVGVSALLGLRHGAA